jgi:hypothetical protein
VARQDLFDYGRIQVRGSVDSFVLHGQDRPKNPSCGNSFQERCTADVVELGYRRQYRFTRRQRSQGHAKSPTPSALNCFAEPAQAIP